MGLAQRFTAGLVVYLGDSSLPLVEHVSLRVRRIRLWGILRVSQLAAYLAQPGFIRRVFTLTPWGCLGQCLA